MFLNTHITLQSSLLPLNVVEETKFVIEQSHSTALKGLSAIHKIFTFALHFTSNVCSILNMIM